MQRRWAKVAAVVLLACAALAGCKRPKPDGSFPALRAAGADSACKSDKDCVISCRNNGNCCDRTCHCDAAYSRAFLEKLDRRWREYCRGNRSSYKCEQVACGGSISRAVARCKKGRCVSVQVPR